MKINLAVVFTAFSSFLYSSAYEQKAETGVIILAVNRQALDFVARTKIKIPDDVKVVLSGNMNLSEDDQAARAEYPVIFEALRSVIDLLDKKTASDKPAVGDDIKRAIFKAAVLEELVKQYFSTNQQAIAKLGMNMNSFSGRSPDVLNQEFANSYKPPLAAKMLGSSSLNSYNQKFLATVLDDPFKKDVYANPNKADLFIAILANDRSFMATVLGVYPFDSLSEASRILYAKVEIDRLVEMKMSKLNKLSASRPAPSTSPTKTKPVVTATQPVKSNQNKSLSSIFSKKPKSSLKVRGL